MAKEELLISLHVLEGRGISVIRLGRSWAPAWSLQNLFQGTCYGQILGGEAAGGELTPH